MKKNLLKKTVVAVLSLALIGGFVTSNSQGAFHFETKLSANAATAITTAVSFDEATGVLTLSGYFSKADVQAFAGNKKVRSVVASKRTYFPYDCRELFCGFEAETFDLSQADASRINNMQDFFSDCKNLTSVDFGSFNSSNATNMIDMFEGCTSLRSIDLNGLDTSSAITLQGMFEGCENLTSVDLSPLDTSNVECMAGMFEGCTSLKSIDLSVMNTSNVDDMDSMFAYCTSLESVDMRGLDLSKVEDMWIMFERCTSLRSVNFSNLDLSNVTIMHSMFYECSELTDVDFSNTNVPNLENTVLMFGYCSKLKSLDLSSFDMSKIVYANCMFQDCTDLENITVSRKWNIPDTAESTHMFKNCVNLTGGCGTVYNDNITDRTYSRIDKPGTPGYLTGCDAVFTKNSMTLGGSIILNFYADLSGIPANRLEDTYVEFNVNGKTQRADFDPNNMNSSHTDYGFICRLDSVSMADDVNATLHYFDKNGIEKTITKTSTAEAYLKKFNENDPPKLWNLIKCINDYGYYMQQYLSRHSANPWTIGVEHKAMAKAYNEGTPYLMNLQTYKSELEQKAKVKNLNSDISNITYALTFDSDTSLNITIKPAASYNGNVTVTVDGKTVTPKKSGSNYKLTISGISAHKLGDMHTVKVTTSHGVSTFKASALSYAYEGITDAVSVYEVYAMCALYDYYKAAINYIG